MSLVRIRIRRGTASEWSSANPILASGEPGWAYDTNVFKIGNGTDHWNDLSGISGGGGGAVDSVNGQTGVVVLDEDDIAAGATNAKFTQTEKTKLAGVATGATANSSDATLLNRANHTNTQSLDTTTDSGSRLAMTPAERTKLANAMQVVYVPLGGTPVRPSTLTSEIVFWIVEDTDDVPMVTQPAINGRHTNDPVSLRVT